MATKADIPSFVPKRRGAPEGVKNTPPCPKAEGRAGSMGLTAQSAPDRAEPSQGHLQEVTHGGRRRFLVEEVNAADPLP